MFTAIIDALLRAALNLLAGRRNKTKGTTPPAAGTASNALEAEVVIGEVIPSQLDLLRQGRAACPGTRASEPVALSVAERRTQMYVHGSTGTGKSVLLTTLLDADIAAGRGVVLLDARGDLVDRVLVRLAARFVPEDLQERLVLIDLRQHAAYMPPGGDTHCAGFNPLAEAGADAYASAFFCFDAIQAQWDLGVQTAEILRNALLALGLAGEASARNKGAGDRPTLLDVEHLLLSEAFRRHVLGRVQDASVLRFFEQRFPKLAEGPQYVSAVLNKITPLNSLPPTPRPPALRTGSQSPRPLLEGRKDVIPLCSLGADELHSAAGLIGSLLISAVAKAVMRGDRPAHRRKETTFLYLDEFENFTKAGRLFEEIISEGRRFGLAAVAAHQSTAQLEPKLRSLTRNIMGIQVYFACGGSDSDLLAGELPSDEPKAVLRNLLISQPVGHALLLRRGKPLTRLHAAFSPDPEVPPEKVAALRQTSLERWGRPKAEVEAEIARQEQRFAPVTEGAASVSGPHTPKPDTAGQLEVREVREAPKARKRSQAKKGPGT